MESKFSKLDTLEVGQSTTYPVTIYHTISPAIIYRQRRYKNKFSRKIEGGRVRVTRTK